MTNWIKSPKTIILIFGQVFNQQKVMNEEFPVVSTKENTESSSQVKRHENCILVYIVHCESLRDRNIDFDKTAISETKRSSSECYWFKTQRQSRKGRRRMRNSWRIDLTTYARPHPDKNEMSISKITHLSFPPDAVMPYSVPIPRKKAHAKICLDNDHFRLS